MSIPLHEPDDNESLSRSEDGNENKLSHHSTLTEVARKSEDLNRLGSTNGTNGKTEEYGKEGQPQQEERERPKEPGTKGKTRKKRKPRRGERERPKEPAACGESMSLSSLINVGTNGKTEEYGNEGQPQRERPKNLGPMERQKNMEMKDSLREKREKDPMNLFHLMSEEEREREMEKERKMEKEREREMEKERKMEREREREMEREREREMEREREREMEREREREMEKERKMEREREMEKERKMKKEREGKNSYCTTFWVVASVALLLAVTVGEVLNSQIQSPVINCGTPEQPKNGFVSSSSTVEDETAIYSCNQGFVMEGQATRTCTSTGNWSGTVPTCRSVDCGSPNQLEGGTVSYDGTGYNMLVGYKCDEGFSLIGSSARVCQSSGKWSGEEPYCEAVKCSELENPMNGKVKLQERTFRSKANYTCNDGFDLVGDSNRTCQADRSWSGNAPFCEFSHERRKDEDARSIYEKISHIQRIATQLQNQTAVAHALEIISINVADGRLQAGMVGLIKSGKSTTLNALMKMHILPEAVQPETAAEVRIIHSRKEEHKSGLLLGEKAGQVIEIASGSENIHDLLRQYNGLARKGEQLPYNSLTLQIPLPFLKESELKFSLEISDTAGPDEAGSTDATLRSLSTMERLSVFIIVLNYRRMKSQSEIDLLTHLREHHPQLLVTHERFLFIVNAIDAYHEDGNKYSIHPKYVREYVQSYLQDTLHVTIPTERIVPFSAKWALHSHLWHENPGGISNANYMSAVGLSAKIKNEEPSKNMRIPSLENKKVVASHLKDFSGIRELEPKLYRMLGINGPVILYKSAIDDTIAHIHTLKTHIEMEKERYDISETTAALHLWEQVSEALSQAVTTNQQKMHELAKNLEDSSVNMIWNWTFTVQGGLSEHIASLQSGKGDSPFTNKEAISNQILKPANRMMEQIWSSIMSTVMGELRQNAKMLFSALERNIKHIESTYSVKLELKEPNVKLRTPPPFTLQLSIPSNIDPLTVSALLERDIATEWAVQFRKTTEAEVSKLSMQTFAEAEKSCRTCVGKLQTEVAEKIKHLRQELERIQNCLEGLNQKAYQLETVHRQLLRTREEFQVADEGEEEVKKPKVEVKKVKIEKKQSSGALSQSHYYPQFILLKVVVFVAYLLL